MKLRSFKLILGILFFLSSASIAQEISPYLVGTNLWYTNPSSSVWNLTKQCGVQMIRIGGAEYDRNMPSNATILSWVKNIRANGAEPIVQVSEYQSAAVAASLVKYLNVDKKGEIAPVKYWNIGNEPWLQANKPSVTTFGAVVEKYFKPIATAMKAVDPTIKIYGPDFCYYIDECITDLFGGKNDITGLVPGKDYYYCDGLSWHRYPQDANLNLAIDGIEDFRGSIVKCKKKVDEVNAKHNRTGDNALSWGIGEYNAEQASKVHSFENGQMFGGVLGLCMKYGAKYAASWSMFENGGNRTGSDKSYIDGDGKPRASYWHMQFVAKYFKGSYCDGTSSSNDFFVYGAKNNDQISVMIMHRGKGAPKEYKLTLDNSTPVGAAYALKVNADTALTYSDMISERTTHIIIFRGDSIVKINYSSTDFDKRIEPQLSTMKTSVQLPNTPTGLKTISSSYNTANLSWTDNSDNEFGYIVEREIGGTFKTIAITSPNTKTYTDSGLAPQTAYKYRVVAYNSLGKSEYSTIETVTTLEFPAAKAFKGPHGIPGKTEAEDFDSNGEGLSFHDTDAANQGAQYRTSLGVDIEKCTDTGLGYNLGYTATGEWLTYLIESVTAGTYDIALRTASGSTSTAAKRIDVYIDQVKVGQVTPTITGDWQKWETKYIKNIEIKDNGPKLIKLMFTGGDFNLNWIQFGKNLSTSVQRAEMNDAMKIYFDNSNRQIHIAFRESMEQANVRVFNALGQSFFSKNYQNLANSSIDVANWPSGIYLVSVFNQTASQTFKIQID